LDQLQQSPVGGGEHGGHRVVLVLADASQPHPLLLLALLLLLDEALLPAVLPGPLGETRPDRGADRLPGLFGRDIPTPEGVVAAFRRRHGAVVLIRGAPR